MSKSRSLGEIIEKLGVHSRGHSFNPKFMKLCQNVNPNKSRSRTQLGYVETKTRSLGQILEKNTCVHSRGQSVDHDTLSECKSV